MELWRDVIHGQRRERHSTVFRFCGSYFSQIISVFPASNRDIAC